MSSGSEGNVTSPGESPELKSLLSGRDAIRLLEISHSCLKCDLPQDFIALFSKLQFLFPFTCAHAILGYRDRSKGIVAVRCVNISFPEGWLSEYAARNYLSTDTTVIENFTSYGAQKWNSTCRRTSQRRIMSLCRDFGLRHGYTVGSKPPLPGCFGAMFSFSCPSLECNGRTDALLEVISPHLHLALARVFNRRSNVGSVVLSAREKEVLNWLKQGKSSWEISVILGISESTVNFHVYNVMHKLDASSRPQAVAAAAHLGLIDLA
jgi:DNA-binding CsgD family transcriptional regulator